MRRQAAARYICTDSLAQFINLFSARRCKIKTSKLSTRRLSRTRWNTDTCPQLYLSKLIWH